MVQVLYTVRLLGQWRAARTQRAFKQRKVVHERPKGIAMATIQLTRTTSRPVWVSRLRRPVGLAIRQARTPPTLAPTSQRRTLGVLSVSCRQ